MGSHVGQESLGLTGVFVVFTEMNGADDIHILVVYGMPIEVLFVKVKDYSNVTENLVYCFVLDIGLALGSDELPGKFALVKAVLGIVDGSVVAFFRIFILAFVVVGGGFLLSCYSGGGRVNRTLISSAITKGFRQPRPAWEILTRPRTCWRCSRSRRARERVVSSALSESATCRSSASGTIRRRAGALEV